MRLSLKKKSHVIIFFAILIVSNVFGISSFIRMVRETHIRGVERDIGAAFKESDKVPPGFGRGEDTLRRLKAIKTGYAPADFKQALSDYIGAYERALITMEAGRDPSAESKPMSDARARMIAIEREYR